MKDTIKLCYFSSILLVCFSCISNKKNVTLDTHSIVDTVTTKSSELKTNGVTKNLSLKMGIGIVKYVFEDPPLENFITLHTPRNNKLYKINVENFKDTFLINSSFAFSPDFGILVFNVLDTLNGFYKIINVQDSLSIIYIEKNDNKLKFETWANHTTSVFSIEFNNEINPLKRDPDISASNILLSKSIYGGFIFHPKTIKEDWLKVEWEDDYNKIQKGWIKWKENGNLIIDLIYFA
ncbi:MAG: hypothetical protein ABI844_10795 [Saprospiraceae bacterium]